MLLSTEFTFFVCVSTTSSTFWVYPWVIVASSYSCTCKLRCIIIFLPHLVLMYTVFHLLFCLPATPNREILHISTVDSVLNSICGHHLPKRIEKHRSQNEFPWNSFRYSIHFNSWLSGPTIVSWLFTANLFMERHHLLFQRSLISSKEKRGEGKGGMLKFSRLSTRFLFWTSFDLVTLQKSRTAFYFTGALVTLPDYIILIYLLPNSVRLISTTLFRINIRLTGL